MKQLLAYTLILFVLIGCGEKKASIDEIIASKDLEQIRAKKTELDKEQQTIQAQLALLEAEIKKMDPHL